MHNHDYLHSNDEPIELKYISQIPFGNQVVSQKSNFSILQNLPEVPATQDKLLEDRIHEILSMHKYTRSAIQNSPLLGSQLHCPQRS